MSRPQKQVVDYFSHDCIHGMTMFILESKFGNDGYAFWYKLLETIGNTPKHYINCRNNGVWEFLQAKTHCSEENAESILEMLAKLQAIDAELWAKRVIWCQNFVDRISEVYKNRRIAAPTRPVQFLVDGCRNNSEAVVSTDNNPSQAVVPTGNLQTKTDKLNKTKLNNTKVLYKSVFKLWNSKKIIGHRNLTEEMKRAIQTCLTKYNQEEIYGAIENYAEVLHDEECWWTYKWTLRDFLKRGIDKFIDKDAVYENYRNKKGNKKIVKQFRDFNKEMGIKDD